MKSFLFLDDTQERHDHFNFLCQNLGVEVLHVFTVQQAINALRNNPPFDCAFLDHDLEEREEWNGFVVATFIALHMERSTQPKNVVIHSWNPDGSKDMESVLRFNGFTNVKRVPFSFTA